MLSCSHGICLGFMVTRQVTVTVTTIWVTALLLFGAFVSTDVSPSADYFHFTGLNFASAINFIPVHFLNGAIMGYYTVRCQYRGIGRTRTEVVL